MTYRVQAAMRPALTLLILAPGIASAQATSCRIPDHIPRPAIETPSREQPRRIVPVGGFTLALSWSPEYCRRRANVPKDRFQCGRAGNRFGFVLHGLWPDGKGAQWPQYCRPARPLPEALIRGHLCEMPSAQLQQHEWAKHGTCATADPKRYFAAASRLYRGLRFPDMDALSRRPLDARGVARAFAVANKGIQPTMLTVGTNRRGWLEEIRLCLGTDLRPRACPRRAGARPGDTVRIWRGG